jgi:hypothetical protein
LSGSPLRGVLPWHFKEFIVEHVSPAAIEQRALELAGLPPEEVDLGLADSYHELAEELGRMGMPSKWHVGFCICHGGSDS